MRTALVLTTLVVALTVSGAMVAAPVEDAHGQDRPGQISPAKVWVENRGRGEAVPVVIHEVATTAPIGVQVIGTPTVAIAPATVLQTRPVRQAWDYRTIDLASGQDVATVLSRAGADGWETTGLQFANPAGTSVVLKRLR